jgi:replicative superfamily II helicase
MLKSSEYNMSSPKKSETVSKKLEEKANNSLVIITPQNVTETQKEDIFWGHFDLNLSESIKGDNFVKASSISMSIDIWGYNKNGLSEENKENLSDIFNGKDFEELKDSFFSLNEGESSVAKFSNEIDDLFSKISKTLDMDEKLFEGSKKLLKFTAIMFSSNLLMNKERDETSQDYEPQKDLMTNALATTAKLYGIIGDFDNMDRNINDALLLNPNNTVREYLNDITNKYSLVDKENKNDMSDLYSTLNQLSKLSQRFNKYLS